MHPRCEIRESALTPMIFPGMQLGNSGRHGGSTLPARAAPSPPKPSALTGLATVSRGVLQQPLHHRERQPTETLQGGRGVEPMHSS